MAGNHGDTEELQVAQSVNWDTSQAEIHEDAEDTRMEKRPVPDGGWGWFIVLGSTLSQIILGGMEKSRGVIYPELIDRFGSGSATTAWVISLTGLIRLCGGPVASVLSNRFGIRPVVMIGSLIVASSFLISAFSTTIVALLFSYGIFGGIGQMCAYAPSVIIVGLYFDKRRALAAGLSSAGLGIGTFVVPPLVELMLEHLGFTGTFFILAGIGLNICVAGALFRPLKLHWKIVDLARRTQLRSSQKADQEKENGDISLLKNMDKNFTEMEISIQPTDKHDEKTVPLVDGERQHGEVRESGRVPSNKCCCCWKHTNDTGAEKSKKPKQKLFDFSLLKDFPFLSFCVTLCLFTMASQIGQVFIPTMAREKGVTKTNSALLLSILGGCDTIGRVGSGLAFDRPRIKPIRQYIYNIFLFLIAGCCCIFPTAYSFQGFACISGAFGFLTGTYIAQKSVIIVDLVGADKLVYSFGMIICFQGIGFLIGPTLSGVLIDYFRRYDFSFYLAGAVSFVAGLVFLSGNICSYRRKQRQSVHESSVIT